jgi:hypothetical protein
LKILTNIADNLKFLYFFSISKLKPVSQATEIKESNQLNKMALVALVATAFVSATTAAGAGLGALYDERKQKALKEKRAQDQQQQHREQRMAQGFVLRQMVLTDAAKPIQCAWRKALMRKRWSRVMERRKLDREAINHRIILDRVIQHACIRIQKVWRGHVGRLEAHHLYHKMDVRDARAW